MVGSCPGGYITNTLAATLPGDVSAGVPFYGTPPAEEIRANIEAPLMIQLAELDERVNATWPEYEKALKANATPYTMHMYPGVHHGFHNDSTARYDEAAAELAAQLEAERKANQEQMAAMMARCSSRVSSGLRTSPSGETNW